MIRDVRKQIEHVDGVSVKQATNTILGVSSFDRAPVYKSPYQFTLYNSQNYLNGFFSQIALTEIRFPWSIPTFTVNNTRMYIYLSLAGVPQANIIPDLEGNYTAASLVVSLNTAVAGAPGAAGNVVFSFNTSIGQFFVNCTGGWTVNIQPVISTYQPNYITMFQMMNWPITPGPGTIMYTTIQSGFPSLLRTKFVDIVCNQLTYNQPVKDSDTGVSPYTILCRLYLIPQFPLPAQTVDLGSSSFLVYKDFSTPKQIKWASNIPVANMEFSVYDDQGYLLTTGNPGFDKTLPNWDMTLLATEL
jgi:hypothetical protein